VLPKELEVLLEVKRSKRNIANAAVALTVYPVYCRIRLRKRQIFPWEVMTQLCVESV